MNKTNRTRAARAALLGLCTLSLLTLYSCASLTGGPVEGRAVDADTGKPLTNAVAYGIWDGLLTLPTRTDGNCIWAESARLDAEGKFLLPAWRRYDSRAPFTSRIKQYVFVYSPGYDLKLLSAGDLPDVKLKPFVGTVDQRFGQLNILPCVPKDSVRRVAIVYRMMAEEMERLAVTNSQRQAASQAREDAKNAGGFDQNDDSRP